MNVRPAQEAGADDAEAIDCRCRVDEYAHTSQTIRRQKETNRRGIVCAKLSGGLTLIRESPIAPAQHILFFVICT